MSPFLDRNDIPKLTVISLWFTCLLSVCDSKTDSLPDNVAVSWQEWQPAVLFCSARYRLHRADAAVAEHHVRKQWSQRIHRELCPSPVSSAPMFGVFAINLLCVSACFLRSFTWPGTFPSSSHLRSFTCSVFPSFPVGMITSHRACRKSSQNLRLHSAEHFIQTYIHTYMHTYIPSFHTSSFFVTHGLSHTTLSQTTVLTSRSFTTSFVFPSFPVPLQHLLLMVHTHTHHTHNLSPHNFLTHNLLTHGLLVAHANPSPSLFSFLHFPCHFYLSFAACWKKLTCGVIRSFN